MCRCAHMLDTRRQSSRGRVVRNEINQAGDQEGHVHGAVLPVLQIVYLEVPLLCVQVPTGRHYRAELSLRKNTKALLQPVSTSAYLQTETTEAAQPRQAKIGSLSQRLQVRADAAMLLRSR